MIRQLESVSFLNIWFRIHRTQLSANYINHFASLRCLAFNIVSLSGAQVLLYPKNSPSNNDFN